MLKKSNYKFKAFIAIILLFIIICSFSTSCSSKEEYPKTADIDYTIVTEADIPDELKDLIKERKQNNFELSYSDGTYLYIVKGYGKHDTSGYNISVSSLYQSDESIIFVTDITGPKDESKASPKITYPYIVVKTEYISNSIVFK